jgi:hypothetical protein
MRVIWTGVVGLSGSLLLACAGIGTPESHAQDAASNIAENERFGRLELVLEKVAPGLRPEFLRAHSAWGGRITIADTELGSFHMIGKEDSELNIRVTWYSGEQELRSTLLHQKWHADKGNWLLTSEERLDGDIGLLGERVIVQAPEESPIHAAQFPTVRIGVVD